MASGAEGVIKFSYEWQARPFPTELKEEIKPLQRVRDVLRLRGWIGVGTDGLGYGNASLLTEKLNYIVISGSQTGGLSQLAETGYAIIEKWETARNHLQGFGPSNPSSESLTHCAMYEALGPVRCGSVLHIHHQGAWHWLLEHLPSTPAWVEYGTPAMAHAVQRVALEHRAWHSGVFGLAGHQGGIVAFGPSPADALGRLEAVFAEAGLPAQ